MRKERLVVVGNGLAGARFVEELLARTGGSKFDVVMFGDGHYRNYNLILLSGVLGGSHEPKDTFLDPLQWYQDNGIVLHASVNNTEGICGRLDEEIERTMPSFQDPWQEGLKPIHPMKFTELLEPVGAGGVK